MSSQLKYNRARLAIIKLIAGSGLRAGDSLPSQKQLTRVLPFGEITIRHALTSMQESGLISSRHGSGTYLVRDIRESKFQNYLLLVSVYNMNYAPWESNVSELRVYLADRGIGLSTVTVTEFGQEVINAVTDDCIGILAEGWLSDGFLRNLRRTGFPVVVLGNNHLKAPVPSVTIDMEEGSRLMTLRMLASGLRKVVLFRGEAGYFLADQEEAGYRRAMAEYGLSPLIAVSPDHYSYYETIRDFMENHPDPQGILSEQVGMMDFFAWCWNHQYVRQPVFGLLSKTGTYHPPLQSRSFFALQFKSYVLRGGQMLLDHIIDGRELRSEKIPPEIPDCPGL